MHRKIGALSPVFKRLLVPLLLFNSPYITCGFVNNGVRVRDPPFLHVVKEPTPPNYLLILFISRLLYLLSRVLVPPPHESTQPRNILRPHVHLIDGAAINVQRNDGLSPLNVLLYSTYPFYIHGVCHWGPFPLSVHCTPIRLPPNPPGHLMVESLHHF